MYMRLILENCLHVSFCYQSAFVEIQILCLHCKCTYSITNVGPENGDLMVSVKLTKIECSFKSFVRVLQCLFYIF